MESRPIVTEPALPRLARELRPESQQEMPDRSGSRFLGEMLDLHGAVQMHSALADRGLGHSTPASELRDSVPGWLEERLSFVQDGMANVFAGQVEVTTARNLKRELNRAGPAMDTFAKGTREVCVPFSRYLERHYANLKEKLAEIRGELTPRVAALGPASARLEALDRMWLQSTQRQTAILRARLLAALRQRLLEEAGAAITALPHPISITDLDPWFAQDGWVVRHQVRVGQLLRAMYAQEASRMRALARGARAGRTG
jgi:hypothetical protein